MALLKKQEELSQIDYEKVSLEQQKIERNSRMQ